MNSLSRCKATGALTGISLAVLTACAVTSAQPYSYAPPAVGSTWTMAYRNTGSYGKDTQLRVTRAEGTWHGAPAVMHAYSNGSTLVIDRASGHWHAVIGANGTPISSWEPPLGPPYPLEVGKTFGSKHRVTVHASGKSSEFESRCTVEAYEKAATPAGTFDAYKVACSSVRPGAEGGLDTYWISPKLGIIVKSASTRGKSSNFGPGTQESELVAYEMAQ